MAKNTRHKLGEFPAKAKITRWTKGDRTGFTIDLEVFAGSNTLKVKEANALGRERDIEDLKIEIEELEDD